MVNKYTTTFLTLFMLAFLWSWLLTLVIFSAVQLLMIIQTLSEDFVGLCVAAERADSSDSCQLRGGRHCCRQGLQCRAPRGRAARGYTGEDSARHYQVPHRLGHQHRCIAVRHDGDVRSAILAWLKARPRRHHRLLGNHELSFLDEDVTHVHIAAVSQHVTVLFMPTISLCGSQSGFYENLQRASCKPCVALTSYRICESV